MNKLSRVGIDLAKNVFQLHGVDRQAKVVWCRRLMRDQWLKVLLGKVEPGCKIGMEACAGAHHWARQLQAKGFTVKLIAPQFVKPYVKSNKNDANDAEAICEAMSRPSMRFSSGDVSMTIGDIDEYGAENRRGVEAFSAGDFAKAYKIWKPLAEQGDAGAQNNLGHLYMVGPQGVVPQDWAEALKWYSRAAEQFHASAYFSIGMLHLIGMGVPRDKIEAFKWIRASAEQGYEYAQWFLGDAYANGWGEVIPQDDAEAIKWMRKAALQGNLDARRYLKNKSK